MPARAKRRSYSAKYKLAILAEYDNADRAGKGALLRREKLYTSLLSEWRKQRDRGALEGLSSPKGRPPVDARDREIERLKADNAKLSGELDRTRRVVEVQGKLSALLEDLSAESADNDNPLGATSGEDGHVIVGEDGVCAVMSGERSPVPGCARSAVAGPFAGHRASSRS